MTEAEAIESMEYAKAQAENALSKGVTQYWKQEINWTIEALDMAIEALSAETVPQSEQYKKGFEDAKRAFLVEYARESENMRKRNAQLEVMLNAQKAILADRPRGEWIVHNIVCREEICLPYECSNCGFRYSRRFNFCSNCGSDNRERSEE